MRDLYVAVTLCYKLRSFYIDLGNGVTNQSSAKKRSFNLHRTIIYVGFIPIPCDVIGPNTTEVSKIMQNNAITLFKVSNKRKARTNFLV